MHSVWRHACDSSRFVQCCFVSSRHLLALDVELLAVAEVLPADDPFNLALAHAEVASCNFTHLSQQIHYSRDDLRRAGLGRTAKNSKLRAGAPPCHCDLSRLEVSDGLEKDCIGSLKPTTSYLLLNH